MRGLQYAVLYGKADMRRLDILEQLMYNDFVHANLNKKHPSRNRRNNHEKADKARNFSRNSILFHVFRHDFSENRTDVPCRKNKFAAVDPAGYEYRMCCRTCIFLERDPDLERLRFGQRLFFHSAASDPYEIFQIFPAWRTDSVIHSAVVPVFRSFWQYQDQREKAHPAAI